jgi:hypothetical protein
MLTSAQVDTELTDNEVNEDNNGGEVSGPRRALVIKLAKWPSCKFCLYIFIPFFHAARLIDQGVDVNWLGQQINQPNF